LKKLILMSVLIATIWLPVAAARNHNGRAGIRVVQKRWLGFCVAYVLALLYIVPRLQ
jgi:hypothetical protein